MTKQRYSVIVEDPAWPQSGGGKSKRGADRHYSLMSVKDILALPVMKCVADDAHYWLWTTDNHLKDAFAVMESRGFRFVRTFVWVKGRMTKDGLKLQRGLGRYGRNTHEYLLFGTRGKAALPPPNVRPDSTIIASRTKHSVKPEEAWWVIEAVSRSGPRVELNARVCRAGWMAVGNETTGTIEQFLEEYDD